MDDWRSPSGIDSVMTCFLTGPVLGYGHVELVNAWVAKFREAWSFMSWFEASLLLTSHLPLMGLLDFHMAGRRMLQAMGCETWDSLLLEEMLQHGR